MGKINDGTKFMIGCGILFILIILLQSCSVQLQFGEERRIARHEAQLKRISADTLARPIQTYSNDTGFWGGLLFSNYNNNYNNFYQPYYNPYYYNSRFNVRPVRKVYKRRIYKQGRPNNNIKRRNNVKRNTRVRSPHSNTRRSNSTIRHNKTRSVNRRNARNNKNQKQ